MSLLHRSLSVLVLSLVLGWASPLAAAEPACAAQPGNAYLRPCQTWAQGIEGQRKADLGDGRYLNPILAGDHPDPSILKDGNDYYMTFSSFEAYPGVTIWHSRSGELGAHRPGAQAIYRQRLGPGAHQTRRYVLRLHPGQAARQ